MPHVLLLGGTSGASQMAQALHRAGIAAVFSYAGVTQSPVAQPLPTRVGGFGGAQGLAQFLRGQAISHVVDATHPFAAQMSRNACEACAATGTPLLALELARICEEAGVPKGLVSVLPGRGSVIGDAITKHPLVKRVSFTGGTSTGKHIAHIAADKMMPVSLELGGKSATMVLADADIDHAVNGVLYGIFSSSGESCIAGSRLFVARSLHAEFMQRLTAKAAALQVGDPADERTQMGPLITAKHRESIESYVALGLSEGGRLLTGGQRPEGAQFERGYYYRPTIIDGVKNDWQICQQEIFGPVLVAMPFDNEDDLLAQANDSVYALAAGIWTRDYKSAWRIGRAVQAGTVWINTYKQFSISTPFGGWRDSGLGREKGRLGIQQYMEQKSMYWGLNDQPLAWAN